MGGNATRVVGRGERIRAMCIGHEHAPTGVDEWVLATPRFRRFIDQVNAIRTTSDSSAAIIDAIRPHVAALMAADKSPGFPSRSAGRIPLRSIRPQSAVGRSSPTALPRLQPPCRLSVGSRAICVGQHSERVPQAGRGGPDRQE